MHKIQIACLNPNKSVSDRNRIREFFPWNDMGETPLKIPEESCLSSRLFSGGGGEVWAQSCVTHMLWYGSLSSPSAVSVTNLIRADKLKHSRYHPTWGPQCGRSQWCQRDTDGEIFLRGTPALPEQHLASRKAPITQAGRGRSALDNMVHSRAVVLLRSNTLCGSGRCSQLFSGLEKLDPVSCLDEKLQVLPEVLRKSMLLAGHNMISSA